MAPAQKEAYVNVWKKVTIWIMTASFPILVTAVGFGYGKLFAHDTAIAVIQTVQEKRTVEFKEYREEIKQEVKEIKELLRELIKESRNRQ